MLNKNTPGVKKSEAKSEAPVSSYSHKQQATDNVRSITYKIQKVQSFTLDVQQFEHI